jgi:hypothetical protein
MNDLFDSANIEWNKPNVEPTLKNVGQQLNVEDEPEPVIFCENCKIDISANNAKNTHLMHEVRYYKRDPRDPRFPVEEIKID